MERKSSCCSGRSYVSNPSVSTPKKEPVVTPKKEEHVKPVTDKNEAVQVQGAASVAVKKEEPVKGNIGSGGLASLK